MITPSSRPKEIKHPPHWYGEGYYMVEGEKRTLVKVCLKSGCKNRKETQL
jgi:hypothetical protein